MVMSSQLAQLYVIFHAGSHGRLVCFPERDSCIGMMMMLTDVMTIIIFKISPCSSFVMESCIKFACFLLIHPGNQYYC
jgi:hypothetical protein